MPGSQ